MARAYNVNNILAVKHKVLDFESPWKEVMDCPEDNGFFLIYGSEKNGKTTLALQFAKYLSSFKKVLYISAEEHPRKASFKNAIVRAGLTYEDKGILFEPYMNLQEIDNVLSRRVAPKIVFVDNLTMYEDDLTKSVLKDLFFKKHSDKLFVFIAHEERGMPAPAIAREVKKLSTLFVRVKGFVGMVGGRCTGGELPIIQERVEKIWGTTPTPP